MQNRISQFYSLFVGYLPPEMISLMTGCTASRDINSALLGSIGRDSNEAGITPAETLAEKLPVNIWRLDS